MDVQVLVVIIGVLLLLVIALFGALIYALKQTGQSYPSDVKHVMGALAALSVFFSLRTENTLDDTVVHNVLLPIFKGLGIDVPKLELPPPIPPVPTSPPAPDAVG